MGNKFMRKMVAVFVAMAMILTSGIGVFAAGSPTEGKTPSTTTKPGQVTGVTSYGHYSKKTMNVSYKAVKGADYYNIYLNGKLWKKGGEKVKGTSTTLKGLKAKAKYKITVEAVKEGKNGAKSKVVKKTLTMRWFKNTKIKNVKKGKKKATVTWKKVKGATGYQITYSKDGKKWKTKNIKGGSKTKATLKKLTKGTWKIKVRPIKDSYMGILSGKKSVKIK